MISKLPRWVWAGGGLLAAIAGMINTVGFLSFAHQGISHLTGTTSLLGVQWVQRNLSAAMHPLGLIAAFVLGAMLGGFLIQDSALKLGRRYGVALLVETCFLCVAVPLLSREQFIGAYFCSAACGLQNALAGTYSGAVVRTSHVTGLFTDIGVLLGHMVRGLSIDKRRLALYFILVFSFFCGSSFAAFLFPELSYHTLYIPATITGVSGFGYTAYPQLVRLRDYLFPRKKL